MKLSILLSIFISFLTFVKCQTISCEYQVDTCLLTIDNPTGFDDFSYINGTHASGLTDDDIFSVRVSSGISPIIPRILCQKFKNLLVLTIVTNIGIETLTEHSFNGCINVFYMNLRANPVREIHPFAFRDLTNLTGFWFDTFQVTTLPEELFSSARKLSWIKIDNSPLLADLPPNIFKNNPLIEILILTFNGLETWRLTWFQHLNKLVDLELRFNDIVEVPRNALNSPNLINLWLDENEFKILDYFSFNDLPSLETFFVFGSPIEALDFNLIDRATNLQNLRARNWKCVNESFPDFQNNREAFMAELEPCFDAFDRRILSFSTSASDLFFNSIRKEEIHVKIQAASDAIIRLSSNPDGSGSNLEIQLGIDNNMQSCLFENGIRRICQFTPGMLDSNKIVTFAIEWYHGFVMVTNPVPLLAFILQNPITVRFIGVGTRGQNATWIIQQIMR